MSSASVIFRTVRPGTVVCLSDLNFRRTSSPLLGISVPPDTVVGSIVRSARSQLLSPTQFLLRDCLIVAPVATRTIDARSQSMYPPPARDRPVITRSRGERKRAPSMNERQRRLPRQEADWPGTYQVDTSAWNACQILDISILGAGLEIFEPARDDLVGRQITVEVQTPAGASITLRMVGAIRYVAATPKGARVGIEFGDLSETERAILNVLEHMRVVW
jgi:hypothetical protein